MIKFAAIAFTACALAGCVAVKHENTLVPPSALVSHISAPLIMPRSEVPCTGLKVGTGSSSVFIKDWLYTGLGAEVCDMTLKEAIANGGIKQVLFADYQQRSVLGFVTFFTVNVYGL